VSINNKKLTVGIKVGYGLGEASSCIVITLLSVYGMVYLTDVVKMPPFFAGITIALGFLFGAFIDPVVGIISDNLKWKWGRRRPLILIAAIPQGIAVWCFFININFANQSFTRIYYLILLLCCFLFNSLLETPHLALSAEMSQDYNERTNILAWRSLMGQIGSVLAGPALIFLYEYLMKYNSVDVSVSISVGVLCVLSVPCVLYSWYSTKNTELFPKPAKFEFKEYLTGPFSNRSFILLTVAFTLTMCAVTMNGVAGIYYLSYVLMLTDLQISIVLFILFGLAIVWIPVIDFICIKFSKKIGWTFFVGMWAISEGIFIQFFLSPGNVMLTYIVFFFIGGGLTGAYMIGWAMISDCVEIDEYKTGKRHEGVYFGFMNFIQKCSCAFVMLAVGLLLKEIGYVADAEQSLYVRGWIKSINGVIGAIALISSILICWLVPITSNKHKALRIAIELKKRGKEFDSSAFKDLL
jgi:glycoside/pentoside/hexuronide:cation symporter, GPH family